jgi:rRNA maturation endonuclease Nob1
MERTAAPKAVCAGVGTKFATFDGGKKTCPVCGKYISLGYTSFALIKHTPKAAS